MTTEEWLRNAIASKKAFIQAQSHDIERAKAKIVDAERELRQYEEDLKKFHSIKD